MTGTREDTDTSGLEPKPIPTDENHINYVNVRETPRTPVCVLSVCVSSADPATAAGIALIIPASKNRPFVVPAR